MRKVVNFVKFYENVKFSWKSVFSQKSLSEHNFNVKCICCKNLPQNHWYSLGISYFSSSGRREPLFSRRLLIFMQKCVFYWKLQKTLKTLVFKDFHDFPRTCCKSSWRLSFLAYSGDEFCRKSWFAHEKDFSRLKFNFTWKVGFRNIFKVSWKLHSGPQNHQFRLGICMLFAHPTHGGGWLLFRDSARRIRTGASAKHENKFYDFKKMKKTCSGPLKIALFWRLVCRGPGPGNAAC